MGQIYQNHSVSVSASRRGRDIYAAAVAGELGDVAPYAASDATM